SLSQDVMTSLSAVGPPRISVVGVIPARNMTHPSLIATTPTSIFPSPLPFMLNGPIKQFRIVAESTDQSGAGSRGGRVPLLTKRSPRFGQSVIDGREMPVVHFREDIAFDVVR